MSEGFITSAASAEKQELLSALPRCSWFFVKVELLHHGQGRKTPDEREIHLEEQKDQAYENRRARNEGFYNRPSRQNL